MANVKNFGLIGVADNVQYGKAGPKLKQTAGVFNFRNSADGADAALTTAGITSSAGNVTLTTGNLVLSSAAGTVGIGGDTLSRQGAGVLRFDGNGAFMAPVGTTAQRPTAATGMVRLNNDATPVMEYYNGTTWTTLATGGTAVSSVTGTAGRITSTGGTTPVIDIDAAYVGQASITTLGTIGTGTWQGTVVGPTYGGTGLATFSTGNVLYASGANTWAAAAPGATSGVQAYDAGLTALAAKSDTGILVQTGADAYASRTLVAPAAGITIAAASGVGGDPTFALADDLAAVEALSGFGYAVRTAADTWTTRTINGTAGNVVVTNGDGVSTNTDVNLATVSQAATGNFVKVTLDGFGRVTGNTPVVAADIESLVDATYVNVSGDTMTGTLNMGTNYVTMTNAPVSDTQAANKAYVDAVAAGLAWKDPTQAATVAALSGGIWQYNNAAAGVGSTLTEPTVTGALTIDGVVLANGNRLLVKDQPADQIAGAAVAAGGTGYTVADVLTVIGGTGTAATLTVLTAPGGVIGTVSVTTAGAYTVFPTNPASVSGGTGTGATFNLWNSPATNGIYNVSGIGGTVVLTRGTNIDAPGEFYGAAVLVTNGTANDNSGWTQTEVVATVGVDPVYWLQFSGANAYIWGDGLGNTGNTVFVKTGAGININPADFVGLDIESGKAVQLTGTGAGDQLTLVLDGAGITSGLTQSGAGLKIAAVGVTNAMLVNQFFNINADSGTVNPVNLGETLLISGTSGQGINTSVLDNTVTITAADATTATKGVSSFTATEFVVTAGNVAIGLVGVPKGGTGITSYAVGDLLYADTVSSLAKLADVAVGNVLRSGGVGVAPAYGQVVLTTDVSGILPSANGGTGVNNGSNTLTLGGNLTTAGAFASTFTMTGATNVTFPTSGTLATVGGTVSTFSGSTTGLTPSSPTSGAITLGGTLVVANGGTGATSFTADRLLIGDGTNPLATSANLTFNTSTLTVGGASPLTVNGATGTIASTATNANINLVPNGTGSVIIGPAGAGLIQSDAGQPLTVQGNTVLTLAAITGDITMAVPVGSNVTVTGPTAAGYAGTLTDTDLVNKYYVDTIAGSASGDIKAYKATVNLGVNASTNIGAALPAGATILSVKVQVTATNTTSTLVVGKSGGAQYMTAGENDPQTTGLYLAESYVTEAGSEQVQATVAAQTGAIGSANVIVTYQIA